MYDYLRAKESSFGFSGQRLSEIEKVVVGLPR